MANGAGVKRLRCLSSLDRYFIDDRAATVDCDPEATFAPGVIHYSDDEDEASQLFPGRGPARGQRNRSASPARYFDGHASMGTGLSRADPASNRERLSGLRDRLAQNSESRKLRPNPSGQPQYASTTARISQRKAAKKAQERFSMQFEEYEQPIDEDDEASSEDSPLKSQGEDNETEELKATIELPGRVRGYAMARKLRLESITDQEASTSTPSGLALGSNSGGGRRRKRRSKTQVAAECKRVRRHPLRDQEDYVDDREDTLERQSDNKVGDSVKKVDKIEEVIQAAPPPMTQPAPVSVAPPNSVPLYAPGPIQNQPGSVQEHDRMDGRQYRTNSIRSSIERYTRRIEETRLQWPKFEEVVINKRFVNAAHLMAAGLRATVVDDLARELGIIDVLGIQDHLNEIKCNQHEGARALAAEELGKVVKNRMIVAGIKSE